MTLLKWREWRCWYCSSLFIYHHLLLQVSFFFSKCKIFYVVLANKGLVENVKGAYLSLISIHVLAGRAKSCDASRCMDTYAICCDCDL